MPVILHKFINDLAAIQQNQSSAGERIAAVINVLVIGTFNPADEGAAMENMATWFYGRTNKNKFWRYFPTACTGHSLIHGTAWSGTQPRGRTIV